jgi:hypothetical protein
MMVQKNGSWIAVSVISDNGNHSLNDNIFLRTKSVYNSCLSLSLKRFTYEFLTAVKTYKFVHIYLNRIQAVLTFNFHVERNILFLKSEESKDLSVYFTWF